MTRGMRKTVRSHPFRARASVEDTALRMVLSQREQMEAIDQKHGGDPAAYSIPQFAAAVGLSRSHVWNLLRRGEGPRIFRVGRRVLVSSSSVAEWISRMEGLAGGGSARGGQES